MTHFEAYYTEVKKIILPKSGTLFSYLGSPQTLIC